MLTQSQLKANTGSVQTYSCNHTPESHLQPLFCGQSTNGGIKKDRPQGRSCQLTRGWEVSSEGPANAF